MTFENPLFEPPLNSFKPPADTPSEGFAQRVTTPGADASSMPQSPAGGTVPDASRPLWRYRQRRLTLTFRQTAAQSVGRLSTAHAKIP